MPRGSFTLLLCAALAAGCDSGATTPGSAEITEMPADNVVEGVSHTLTKDGVRSGALRADSAYMYEQDRKMDLRGVHLTFFGENGQQTGTLTSSAGEYHLGTRSFVARGNVVLVTEGPNGTRRLETEELHYDVAGDQLWSDVDFAMTEGGRTTRGSSFRSDSKFENWTVANARTQGGMQQPGGGVSF